MARAGWDSLSDSYRGRLERSGVTRSDYERGESIAKGRGHSQTPEHPERAELHPDRYREYVRRRTALEQQVIAKKEEAFRGSPKWNATRAARNVHKVPHEGFTKPPSIRLMKKFLDEDFDYDQVDWADDEWGFLYYH